MGSSTTIAHALLTIAAITVASAFAFAMILKTGSLTSSISQLVFSQSNELRTDLTIVEVQYDPSLGAFVVYVKNTGLNDIPLSQLELTDVYLGTYGGSLSLYLYNPAGGAGYWNYTKTVTSASSWVAGETLIVKVYNNTRVDPPYHVRVVLPGGEGAETVDGG